MWPWAGFLRADGRAEPAFILGARVLQVRGCFLVSTDTPLSTWWRSPVTGLMRSEEPGEGFRAGYLY